MKYGNYTKLPKPFIAEENIVVYKFLLPHDVFNWLITPFYRVPIVFDNEGKCELVSDMSYYNKKYPFGYGHYSLGRAGNAYLIENGIHSYRTPTVAVPYVFLNQKPVEKYIAVIPKGSMYYIGRDGDSVASEKLFIFKTEADFDTYIEKEGQVKQIEIEWDDNGQGDISLVPIKR